jgi:hypothetical protein
VGKGGEGGEGILIPDSGRDKWMALFIFAASSAQLEIPTTPMSNCSFGNGGSISPCKTLSGLDLQKKKKKKKKQINGKFSIKSKHKHILRNFCQSNFIK